MLDLKIVEADQYDLVPVPLPGRLIVFAGPDGLMCRRNDGAIANYPDTGAGGGGFSGVVEQLTFVTVGTFEQIPLPPSGHVVFGVVEAEGEAVPVYRDSSHGVYYMASDQLAWAPPAPAPT